MERREPEGAAKVLSTASAAMMASSLLLNPGVISERYTLTAHVWTGHPSNFLKSYTLEESITHYWGGIWGMPIAILNPANWDQSYLWMNMIRTLLKKISDDALLTCSGGVA